MPSASSAFIFGLRLRGKLCLTASWLLLALLNQLAPLQASAESMWKSPEAELPSVDFSNSELYDLLRRADERISSLEALHAEAQQALADQVSKKKAWYEKINLRGYLQVRSNETTRLKPGSAPAQHVGDSGVGDNQTLTIRRARLTFSGDVTDKIFVYFQPEFAASVPGSPDGNHFAQIRDWYTDLHLDDDREFRFRVGQSKVPYGWENLQSSRDRIPLDRNDPFNSAVKNERDLGIFFYWTPEFAQDFFKRTDKLKGSGNYGVFGFGAYTGQGGSLMEQNDNLHLAARFTWPITFANGQMMELGIQGLTGKYTVLSAPISPLGVGPAMRPTGTLETGTREGIRDERLGWSLIVLPQPFGFQTEWTIGRGPSLDETQTHVTDRALYGGYAMFLYRLQTEQCGEFYPFTRWCYYQGGYKSERNAPYSEIDEWEIGLEWQLTHSLEIVTMYTITDRTNTRAVSMDNALSYRQFRGDLLRFQAQIRY